MLDHLTRQRTRIRARDLGGVGISLALHGALIAALVLGAQEIGRDGREAPRSVGEAGWEGRSGGDVGNLAVAPPSARPEATLGPTVRMPDTLALGRTSTVSVVLPPTRITEDSLLLLPAGSGEILEVRIAQPRLASLVAENAVVVPHAPPVQLSGPDQAVEWRWSVRPTEPGIQALMLSLDAIAHVAGRDSVLTLGSVRREVFVQATRLQRMSRFFAHHWTWLSLLGVAAALAWLRERRRRPVTPAPA